MLDGGSEGDVFDEVAEVEKDNEEVEPEEMVGGCDLELRPPFFRSPSDAEAEGETAADHLNRLVGPVWHQPPPQPDKEVPQTAASGGLQAADVLLDDEAVCEPAPDTFVVALQLSLCHTEHGLTLLGSPGASSGTRTPPHSSV